MVFLVSSLDSSLKSESWEKLWKNPSCRDLTVGNLRVPNSSLRAGAESHFMVSKVLLARMGSKSLLIG